MTSIMDKIIRNHIHAIDHVTGRKRLFTFAANKVTELHIAGDTVGMLIMPEEGELKPNFVDYLLVTTHTGHALMRDGDLRGDVREEAWTNGARDPLAMHGSCL